MSLPEGYEAVIGLEIHVQLQTQTKMFCGCALSFGDEPNVHTCPVCLAHPGSLPTVNERAVDYALQIGMALECELAPRSIFHRKNYFYPDNPKGVPDQPVRHPAGDDGPPGRRSHPPRPPRGGRREDDPRRGSRAASTARRTPWWTSIEPGRRWSRSSPSRTSASAEEAREWAQLLRTTVRQLGVSDVNMEEGSLRVDANVSVRRAGESELGTKTELKNMNSFRFLERGIEAELDRQVGVVESGEEVAQETFHFDPRTGSLTPLRSKEYAHDYRYFPEPDLVPLAPTEEMLSAARDALPELPAKRRERYRDELGLPDESARQLAFDADLGEYFENALDAADGLEPRIVANWVTGELAAAQRHFGHKQDVEPAHVAEVVRMVADKRISHASGREVLHTLSDPGSSVAGPEEVVEGRQLEMESDASALEAIVAAAIEAEPAAAEKVRAGNPKAVGPIVGAVMRETKGTADGGEVTRLIREQLGAG